MRRALHRVGRGLVGIIGLMAVLVPVAWGAGACAPTRASSAPSPQTCANSGPPTYPSGVSGVDSCGNAWSLPAYDPCVRSGPAPSCALGRTTVPAEGQCSHAPYPGCTTLTLNCVSCVPTTPLACGATGPGTCSNCGLLSCTASGPPCPVSPPPAPTWVPYGFAMPGDPLYGFPHVTTNPLDPLSPLVYPNPMTQDLVGFAAKGNIVIGDYTSTYFQTNTLPLINPGPRSKTQPYAVDPTDISLGYDNARTCPRGMSPCFSGDYDRAERDTRGRFLYTRSDGTHRKFYESSLTDFDFQQYLNMPTGSGGFNLNGAFYTNHALAGFITGTGMFTTNGTLVSRDDGLLINGPLRINHDIRLLNGSAINQIVLPMAMTRMRLTRVQTCDPQHCP